MRLRAPATSGIRWPTSRAPAPSSDTSLTWTSPRGCAGRSSSTPAYSRRRHISDLTGSDPPSMRALVVTNIYPSPAMPALGTFVADQVKHLRTSGVAIDLVYVDRAERGRRAYRELGAVVRQAVDDSDPDLVHVMYGGVMAEVVTRTVRDRPVLVAFCGTDLLGGRASRGGVRGAGRYGVLASQRAAKRATGVTVKSRNLFDALPSRVTERRTWIVPDGVDLERFRPLDQRKCRSALGLDPSGPHVLFPAAPNRPEKRYWLAHAAV